MDEKYRLVFRGELLDGQHRAVVKRRLAERLKLDDAQVEKLFSGDPVIVKRDADKKTAATYQAVFKQAGGLLRVQPVVAAGTDAPARSEVSSQGAPEPAPAAESPRASREAAAEHARLRAIRPGANPEAVAPDFKVQASYFPAPREPAPEIQAPDFVVAEAGTLIAEPRAVSPAEVGDLAISIVICWSD